MYQNKLILTNGNQKTVKEKIISILGFEWPLTAKEIYLKVTKEHSKPVSYQAIHKALTELLEELIIEKKENEFLLKKAWIKNHTNFFSYLNSAYIEEKTRPIDYELKKPVHLIFNDISEFTVQIATWFAEKTFIKEGPPNPTGLFRHAWWPSRFNFKDFQLLIKVVKNNLENGSGYAVVKEDSPFDRWILNQYKLGGFKHCKTGAKIDYLTDDFFIHGDVIFQTTLSEQTKQLMDEYYLKVKNLQDLYKFYMNKKTEKKSVEIKLTITRNKQFAASLRELASSYFE